MTDHGKGAAPAGRVMTRSLAALHSEDVYRFASARRVRLGSAAEIVYVPHKREACVLPASVSHARSQCTGAASLSTVGSLMVKHGAARDDHEGDLLALALRQLGLLVPADGLLAGAPGGADEERAARGISTIAIVTCGRSEALIRACDSYLTNAYDFGHRPALLVLDDAESPHPWQRVAGALTRSGVRRFRRGPAGAIVAARVPVGVGAGSAVPPVSRRWLRVLG
jgi:hypothetical protein